MAIEHPLFFIPANAKGRNNWWTLIPIEGTCSGEACTVDLPTANDRGSWNIECETCPAWALVTVEKSVSDPKEFTMPCGRVRIWADDTNLPT